MLLEKTLKFNIKLTLSCITLLNYSVCFAQGNSNYLELLEGEANNLTLDQETITPSKQNKASTLNTLSDDEGIPTSLTFEEFMNTLKINYIGTYFFAKRLSISNQNKVYTFYQNNSNPQAIRTQIIKISKNK